MVRLGILVIALVISSCARTKDIARVYNESTTIERVSVDSVSIDEILTKIVKTDGVTSRKIQEDISAEVEVVTEDLDTVGRVTRRQVATLKVSAKADAVMVDTISTVDSTVLQREVDIVSRDTTAIVASLDILEQEVIENTPAKGVISIVCIIVAILLLLWLARPQLL